MSRFFERFFFPGWVIHPVILLLLLVSLLVGAGVGVYFWLV